jgi:hypothetical protein
MVSSKVFGLESVVFNCRPWDGIARGETGQDNLHMAGCVVLRILPCSPGSHALNAMEPHILHALARQVCGQEQSKLRENSA